MTVTLPEQCLHDPVSGIWRTCLPTVARLSSSDTLMLDADSVIRCDGAGEALILELHRRAASQGFTLQCRDARGVVARTLERFRVERFTSSLATPHPVRHTRLCEQLGRTCVHLATGFRDQTAFLGEATVSALSLPRQAGRFRLRDALLHFERAGIDALPIVLLIGFLLGLILAFMSATSFRQFGVEVYVADLIAIGLFRELGPLNTAILLAGRSGSAFAAEIGTMKVNEEIDALVTLGLRPVTFLALPRILAATLVMPILSTFSVLAGLLGGVLVMAALGVPPLVFWQHAIRATSLNNVLFGLVKAAVFGLLVGLVGCAHGLQTRRAADGVGRAATAAVVGSLVLITVADGLFAVLAYLLGV